MGTMNCPCRTEGETCGGDGLCRLQSG
jgi:hypothetical protein